MKKGLSILLLLGFGVSASYSQGSWGANQRPTNIASPKGAAGFPCQPTHPGAFNVSDVDDGFVVFGVEVQVVKGQEPLVTAHLAGGSTLREALAVVMDALHDYEFATVAPHLVNVAPKQAS